MFCSKCGNELTEEDKFCPKCGSAVEDDVIDNDNSKIEHQPNTKSKRVPIVIIIGLSIIAIVAIRNVYI